MDFYPQLVSPAGQKWGGFADDTSDIHILVPAEFREFRLNCLALCEAGGQGAGFTLVEPETARLAGMGSGSHSPSGIHAGKSWHGSICSSMFW